jgi:hypothetical protein
MRKGRFQGSCELRDPDLPPGKQLIADWDAAGEHNLSTVSSAAHRKYFLSVT